MLVVVPSIVEHDRQDADDWLHQEKRMSFHWNDRQEQMSCRQQDQEERTE